MLIKSLFDYVIVLDIWHYASKRSVAVIYKSQQTGFKAYCFVKIFCVFFFFTTFPQSELLAFSEFINSRWNSQSICSYQRRPSSVKLYFILVRVGPLFNFMYEKHVVFTLNILQSLVIYKIFYQNKIFSHLFQIKKKILIRYKISLLFLDHFEAWVKIIKYGRFVFFL